MQITDIKPAFTYRPNPVFSGSFLICKKEADGALQPVGDYTLLDRNEDISLTERKVMNLVTAMNGGTDLLPLGAETKSRTYFHRKPKLDAFAPTEIIFYAQTGEGVSKENAILTIEGDFDA